MELGEKFYRAFNAKNKGLGFRQSIQKGKFIWCIVQFYYYQFRFWKIRLFGIYPNVAVYGIDLIRIE